MAVLLFVWCYGVSAQGSLPMRDGLYTVSNFAGSDAPPPLKEGPADQVALTLSLPDDPEDFSGFHGLTIGPAGEIYFGNSCAISRLANGTVAQYANPCIWRGGGPSPVYNLAADSHGNVYSVDGIFLIRVTPQGDVSAVAGVSGSGCTGDEGPASQATLFSPLAVAAGQEGNLYVGCGANRIRKITPDGMIHLLAALPSEVTAIGSLACDSLGNVYAVVGNGTSNTEEVYRVSPDGSALLVQGLPLAGYVYEANLYEWRRVLGGIAVDAAGNVYISGRADNRIRKIDPTSVVSILAGSGDVGELGDGGPASAAQVADPDAMAIDSNGVLVFADRGSNKLRKINLRSSPPLMEFVAGGGGRPFRDGPGNTALFGNLGQIARDGSGNLFVADTGNHRIRKIATDGTVSTVVGNGLMGFAGDGQAATAASLDGPTGVALDSKGNLWIADTGNRRIRKVTPDGLISTAAGSGACTHLPPGCGPALTQPTPAPSAGLNLPGILAIDLQENVYIGEGLPNSPLLLKLSNGVVAPVWTHYFLGFGLDAAGNLYFSNLGGVEKVDDSGSATAFANTLGGGYLTFDAHGNLYAGVQGFVQKISGDGSHTEPVLATSLGSFVVDPNGVIYAPEFGTSPRVYQYTPAPAGGLAIVSGNNQSGPTGVSLPQGITVTVVDAAGNPLTYVPIQFSVVSGSATLNTGGDIGERGTTVDVVMFANTASVYVVPNAVGPIVVTASVSGLPSVSFTLTGLMCAESLSETTLTVPAAGAYSSVSVATNLPGCAWTSSSGSDWVTLQQGNGFGNGSVNYKIDPNTGVARSGAITIAGVAVTISQAAGPPGPLVTPLVGSATGAILNGSLIASGEWVTIYGFNLAPDTRTWSASDIVGNQLPTSLDGVSVRIHGKLAYLSYISPGQINALVPADGTLGAVDLVVMAPNGSSAPVSVQKVAFAPSFFTFPAHPPAAFPQYVAAVLPDGTYVAPAGWFAGVSSRPAVPGETVQIFATGLGPTNPPFPDGQTIGQALPLANPIAVTLGDFGEVPIQFAGLVAPGLYQVNLTVPHLPDVNTSLCISIAGGPAPACASLAVQQ